MTSVFEAGLLKVLGRYIAVLAVLGALALFLGIVALIYAQSMISSPGGIGAPVAPPGAEAVEKRLAEGATGPAKDVPDRGPAPEKPKLTAQQQNLVDFATMVDPDKGRTYFTAYGLARRTANRCGRGARLAFSAGLKDAYAKLSAEAKSGGHQAAVAAYCSLWRDAARERDRAADLQARARRQGRRVREVSIGVVVGALGFLVTLSLPLALIAIAGNTRALTDLAEAIARSDKTPGPGPGAAVIVLLAAGLMAGPALAQGLPGLDAPPGAAPPVMTEDQILREKVRKLREAALEARRKHVGKAYVFQPSWTTTYSFGSKRGQTRTVKATTWFYRAPYTLWLKKPKTRFRPVRLTRFTVQGLDTVACYSSTYSQRKKSSANECYFYRVDLGGGLIAYLEAGRLAPQTTTPSRSRYRNRNRAKSGFTGVNALAFVSSTPRGAILSGMPDDLRRLTEADKARKAAERAARQARLARERKARAARRKQETERRTMLYRERARKREEERKARAAKQREEWRARAREREAERKAARERARAERKARTEAARRARLAKRFPEAWIDGILAGRVETGWNTAAVRAAWGRPRHTLRVPPSDEMWVYRGKHVIFSDGKVRKVAEEAKAAGSAPGSDKAPKSGTGQRPENAIPDRIAPEPGGLR
jgi:hypothetical protein